MSLVSRQSSDLANLYSDGVVSGLTMTGYWQVNTGNDPSRQSDVPCSLPVTSDQSFPNWIGNGTNCSLLDAPHDSLTKFWSPVYLTIFWPSLQLTVLSRLFTSLHVILGGYAGYDVIRSLLINSRHSTWWWSENHHFLFLHGFRAKFAPEFHLLWPYTIKCCKGLC